MRVWPFGGSRRSFQRKLQVVVLSLTVVIAAGSGSAASEKAPDTESEVVVSEVIAGIPNLWIQESLLLSGQPTADAFGLLAQRGIEVVLDLRHPAETTDFDEDLLVRSLGMDHSSLPFGSADELTDGLLDEIRTSLRQGAGRSMILHCRSGNRVGAVWLAFRVLDQSASWEEALAQARQVGLSSATLEDRIHAYISDPLRVRWTGLKQEIRAEFPEVEHLSVAALAHRFQDEGDGPFILDVRELREYEVSHLQNARRAVNLTEALEQLRDISAEREIVVYCSVGYRSAKMAASLAENGFLNIRNLEGSIFEWANQGLPLYRSGRDGSKLVREVHPYDDDWGRLLDGELWSTLR